MSGGITRGSDRGRETEGTESRTDRCVDGHVKETKGIPSPTNPTDSETDRMVQRVLSVTVRDGNHPTVEILP